MVDRWDFNATWNSAADQRKHWPNMAVSNLGIEMDDIHNRVRINFERASERMKYHYDVPVQEGG